MPQPVATPPRRPLSAPEDVVSRRAVERWEAVQPRDEREELVRRVTFNSAA